MDFEKLIEQAEALPLTGGSLTFKMLVAQGDWETVNEMLDSQQDALHGVSTLSDTDWTYLKREAGKDGRTL